MRRSWLLLVVLGVVVLAGCSAPGRAPTATPGDGDDGGDVAYPDGWGPDGLVNATRAVQSADAAVAGDDFAERLVSVEPTTIDGERRYVVNVLVVRVDFENQRLLTQRRYYVVSNETAGQVADSGTDALGDREPGEVRRYYLDSSGGVEYYRLGSRGPRVSRLQSGDFASATDRRLPGQLVNAFPLLESGTYTGTNATGSTVTYAVAGVAHRPFRSGSGHVTVRKDGLVTEFAISESGSEGLVSYDYELDHGDLTVEPPDWREAAG